jgi:outer membrane protein insertion porin family
MKLRYLFGLTARLLAVVFVIASLAAILQAQTPAKVSKIEIRHVGPATASDNLIRSHIRIKIGEPFLQTSVDDDVRNLYATGFFANIQVQQQTTPEGVGLIYELQGKPLLTAIKFSGNKKYKDKKLLTKTTAKVGQPLDEKKLFMDAQEIQKMYQKAGYPRTVAKYVLSVDEQAGRGTATFEITESPKVKIEKVEFVGATEFTHKKLAKVVKTRKRWMFSWLTGSGYIKDEMLEDDKEKLAEFYRNEGYIDFELKEVKQDSTGPKSMVVRFMVTEGKKYQVGGVAFKGNTLFTTNELGSPLKMGVNKTFTPKGLSADVEAIKDIYGAKGYVDTSVLALKSPNVEKGTMDIIYQIEEGEKSYIEKIEIRGNVKTKDKVIRRELAVAPGEVFDTVRVKLSKDRLEGLNYFEKVDARPEPTDVRGRKNLVVGVDEKSTGNFMIGAGFSSVDSVVGFAEFTQGNFDLFKPPKFEGAGQKFRLRSSIGTRRQDYQISFVEPWFLERKLAFGVDLYHRRLDFVSANDLYDERRTGARLSLTRALGSDFLIGSVSYTIENVGIVNVSDAASPIIQAEAGSRVVSKVGTSLAYDTRNNATFPTKGQRTELLDELAGGPFMGDTDYYKFELRHATYFPGFWEGHVFEITGRSGAVERYGDSTRVPIFDRYFLGGLYSLRGYDYREVGPRDAFGEPIGGETYWYGSMEYSLPIIERLRFAMFYDIGKVYGSSFSFNPNTAMGESFYNDNWGVGLRLNLPIGPLRFDFGVPMHTDINNDSSGKFQFGVGYTREF